MTTTAAEVPVFGVEASSVALASSLFSPSDKETLTVEPELLTGTSLTEARSLRPLSPRMLRSHQSYRWR